MKCFRSTYRNERTNADQFDGKEPLRRRLKFDVCVSVPFHGNCNKQNVIKHVILSIVNMHFFLKYNKKNIALHKNKSFERFKIHFAKVLFLLNSIIPSCKTGLPIHGKQNF